MIRLLATTVSILALAAPFAAAHGKVYRYDRLPQSIRQAFEAHVGTFASADATHDTEMGHNTFQVTAHSGERRHSIIFAFDATILVEEIDCAPSELPGSVRAALERQHPGARVLAAIRETNFTTDPDHVAYHLTINQDGLESDVWIDASGDVENVHVNLATSTPEAASAERRRLRARLTDLHVH